MAPPLRCVLVLALVVSACSRPPESEPTATSPGADPDVAATSSEQATETSRTQAELAPAVPSPDPPVLTTIRTGGGALATLTFRTAEGVPLSEAHPLVLTIGDRVFEAPLSAGPARFTESDGAVVDQASYVLDGAALRALGSAPTDAVTVSVALPDAYADFPYVSGDLVD